MKIEVLYPEICCLFGDKANMRYFEMCLPEAEFIKTPVSEMPRFLTEDVDMVYFGSCSESNQERILSRLKDHKARIEELIEKGVIFLMTGNSFEIMGNYIEKPDGEVLRLQVVAAQVPVHDVLAGFYRVQILGLADLVEAVPGAGLVQLKVTVKAPALLAGPAQPLAAGADGDGQLHQGETLARLGRSRQQHLVSLAEDAVD